MAIVVILLVVIILVKINVLGDCFLVMSIDIWFGFKFWRWKFFKVSIRLYNWEVLRVMGVFIFKSLWFYNFWGCR